MYPIEKVSETIRELIEKSEIKKVNINRNHKTRELPNKGCWKTYLYDSVDNGDWTIEIELSVPEDVRVNYEKRKNEIQKITRLD